MKAAKLGCSVKKDKRRPLSQKKATAFPSSSIWKTWFGRLISVHVGQKKGKSFPPRGVNVAHSQKLFRCYQCHVHIIGHVDIICKLQGDFSTNLKTAQAVDEKPKEKTPEFWIKCPTKFFG